jgi:hypothetical protein
VAEVRHLSLFAGLETRYIEIFCYVTGSILLVYTFQLSRQRTDSKIVAR